MMLSPTPFAPPPIMEGLQRLSALPLDAEVIPLKDATASSAPALLISAAGWNDAHIALPVGAGADSTLDVQRLADDGQATTLQLDPGQQLGSLQTVVKDGRPLMIATSNDAAAELGFVSELARPRPDAVVAVERNRDCCRAGPRARCGRRRRATVRHRAAAAKGAAVGVAGSRCCCPRRRYWAVAADTQ